MKYITTKDEKGKEEIFLFNDDIHHDCMGEILGFIKNQTHGSWMRVPREPISAGFVDGNMNCHGHSETLKLKSRPTEDTGLLMKQLSR